MFSDILSCSDHFLASIPIFTPGGFGRFISELVLVFGRKYINLVRIWGEKIRLTNYKCGAGGTRTHKVSLPEDFKSSASAKFRHRPGGCRLFYCKPARFQVRCLNSQLFPEGIQAPQSDLQAGFEMIQGRKQPPIDLARTHRGTHFLRVIKHRQAHGRQSQLDE